MKTPMKTEPNAREVGSVEALIARTKHQLNRARAVRIALLACAVGGAAAAIGGGAFLLAGARVPVVLYVVVLVCSAAIAWAAWVIERVGDRAAAQFLDKSFGLDDGLTTSLDLHHTHAGGAFGALQVAWAARRAEGLEPTPLMPKPGRLLIAGAILLPTLAVSLGFAPESAAVVAERERFARTLVLSAELNKGIGEAIEDTIASADEEELAELEPNELRELADALEMSGEQADLLRQYAEMEHELAARAEALQAPRAEELMARAGEALSEGDETARLGRMLEEKRFDEAAKELEKFKPAPEVTAEDLARRREEAERLKKLTKRLADARRRMDAAQSAAGKPSRSASDRSANTDDAQTGRLSSRKGGTTSTNDDQGRPIEGEIREMEEAVEELERALAECEHGACEQGELNEASDKLKRARSAVNSMQGELRKLGAKQRARSKLSKLRSTLAQCQSTVAGQSQSPFAGGREAGQGSAKSQNAEVNRDDGRQLDLQGIQGQGPSELEVEEADSGSGVTTRGEAARNVDYQRQFESFVERPDVPDALKEGVREYLERIHRGPADAGSTDEEDGTR